MMSIGVKHVQGNQKTDREDEESTDGRLIQSVHGSLSPKYNTRKENVTVARVPLHSSGQFTPKMKANAEPRLLSSLV